MEKRQSSSEQIDWHWQAVLEDIGSLHNLATMNTDTLPRLRTKFGERAFSHAGPAAWNSLPEDIRTNQDREVFRKQLKTYFFTLAFNVH